MCSSTACPNVASSCTAIPSHRAMMQSCSRRRTPTPMRRVPMRRYSIWWSAVRLRTPFSSRKGPLPCGRGLCRLRHERLKTQEQTGIFCRFSRLLRRACGAVFAHARLRAPAHRPHGRRSRDAGRQFFICTPSDRADRTGISGFYGDRHRRLCFRAQGDVLRRASAPQRGRFFLLYAGTARRN